MGKVTFKAPKAESSKAEGEARLVPQAGNIYFFHPDHLGTATYLTDINGNPYQFFLNLPFGETMAEQHSLSEDYSNPYKFNGKELDEETGLYYYGARYYDPRTSIWLSVDPLMEKYPNISPYVYVSNNPIVAIDPDGRGILNVIGNIFKRATRSISNLITGDCNCRREKETIGDAWRRPDPTTLLLMNTLGIDNGGNPKGIYNFYENENIQFDNNSAVILQASEATLDKLATILKDKNIKKITLTGNSNVQFDGKGNPVKNDDVITVDEKDMTVRELKLKRAEAVKEYLIKQGVNGKKMM